MKGKGEGRIKGRFTVRRTHGYLFIIYLVIVNLEVEEFNLNYY